MKFWHQRYPETDALYTETDTLYTHLASIFLTFSVTRAIVSSVFKGQEDNDDGLLTSDGGGLAKCWEKELNKP